MSTIEIHPQQVNYLKAEIEGIRDNSRIKRALQDVCQLHWRGRRIGHAYIDGMENAVIGAFHRSTSDEKVRRWCLSALSQFGRKKTCLTTAKSALGAYGHEPQVLSAAIATMFKLDPEVALKDITSKGSIPVELVYLSALQSVRSDKLEPIKSVIDVEKADALPIKLALVLVGLNKAPDNIFNPNHTNASLVRALGGHHEPIIKQYSAWAVAENAALTVKDLGVDISTVSSQPDNIRSYIYRLYASEVNFSPLQSEIIQTASFDDEPEARLGAAIGIRNTWFEGIDSVTVDWVFREDDPEIRSYLYDHFAMHSARCANYHRLVVDEFDRVDTRGARRLLSASSGQPLFAALRRIEYEKESGDLFGGSQIVTNNNTFNINGTLTAGQFVGVGDANSQGSFQVNQKTEAMRQADIILQELLQAMMDQNFPVVVRNAVADSAEKAKAEPTKENLVKLVNALENGKKIAENTAGIAKYASVLGGYLEPLTNMLGSL